MGPKTLFSRIRTALLGVIASDYNGNGEPIIKALIDNVSQARTRLIVLTFGCCALLLSLQLAPYCNTTNHVRARTATIVTDCYYCQYIVLIVKYYLGSDSTS